MHDIELAFLTNIDWEIQNSWASDADGAAIREIVVTVKFGAVSTPHDTEQISFKWFPVNGSLTTLSIYAVLK